MLDSCVSNDFVEKPFRVAIPDEVLVRIRSRVQGFRWEAYDEPEDAGDWRYGPPKNYMRQFCDYWVNQYDWRSCEQLMDQMPRFVANVDGFDLHYVHARSHPDAPTLLIAHGWPYSSHSYDGIIDALTQPERHGGRADDAFNVVVPSFPGYDFAAKPREPMGPKAMALLFDKLMSRLGYGRYMVHGGDWGAHVTSLLGFHRPERIIGIHSTALCLREAGAEQLTGELPFDASEAEKAFVERELKIWKREGAYSQLHATKPAKLSYAMFDSPVGTAAWIVEAFYAWSDRRDRAFADIFSFDQLVTEVMLYLVTDAMPSSTWIYGAKEHEEKTLPPGQRVEVPTALAAFQDPVFPMPPRSVAERSHHVVQYSSLSRGGHFPFYEAPDLLVEDLRLFRRRMAPDGTQARSVEVGC